MLKNTLIESQNYFYSKSESSVVSKYMTYVMCVIKSCNLIDLPLVSY